jgi:hypothetical protein
MAAFGIVGSSSCFATSTARDCLADIERGRALQASCFKRRLHGTAGPGPRRLTRAIRRTAGRTAALARREIAGDTASSLTEAAAGLKAEAHWQAASCGQARSPAGFFRLLRARLRIGRSLGL